MQRPLLFPSLLHTVALPPSPPPPPLSLPSHLLSFSSFSGSYRGPFFSSSSSVRRRRREMFLLLVFPCPAPYFLPPSLLSPLISHVSILHPSSSLLP